MDSYRKYVIQKQRRERRDHWLGIARELTSLILLGIFLVLFLVIVAPHLP